MNSEYKRGWLEVLKFLSPFELLSTGTVCTQWNKWSRYDEVWQTHLVVPAREVGRSFREVCKEQFFRPQFLVHISSQGIKLHSPSASASRKSKFPRDFHLRDYATWVSLPQGVLICGGVDNGKSVSDCYTFHFHSEAIEKLPNMTSHRASAGLAYFYGNVYVFGGSNTEVKGIRHTGVNSCEKFNLATKVWTSLPNMISGRSDFIPSRLSASIYIAGGYHSDNCIEVFSLVSETFQQRIPFLKSISDSETSIATFRNTLVIVSGERFYQYDVKTQQVINKRQLTSCQTIRKAEAVIRGRFVYLSCGNKIRKLPKDLILST